MAVSSYRAIGGAVLALVAVGGLALLGQDARSRPPVPTQAFVLDYAAYGSAAAALGVPGSSADSACALIARSGMDGAAEQLADGAHGLTGGYKLVAAARAYVCP